MKDKSTKVLIQKYLKELPIKKRPYSSQEGLSNSLGIDSKKDKNQSQEKSADK